MKQEFFFINGVRHCVHVLLSGTPCVTNSIFALHGFTGSGLDFLPIAENLGSLNWYLPDFIGHGQSESPNEEHYYSLNPVTYNFKSLLDLLSIKKTILMGYSMGGRIALHLAHRYPEVFLALILIGASPGIKDFSEAKKRVKSDNDLANILLKDGINHFNKIWSKKPLIATQNAIPDHIKKPLQIRREANNVIGLANCLKKLGAGILPSLWTELKDIHLPVLLLAGENDSKYSFIANNMKACLPFSEKVLISSAGHAAHLENMPDFIKNLKLWLEKL